MIVIRIERDGHLRGGRPPRPWVALVSIGRSGVTRQFIREFVDWTSAFRARSGNVYGRVHTFPIMSDGAYEMCVPRGKPSKRYMSREWFLVIGGKRYDVTAEEAMEYLTSGTTPTESERP